MSTVIHSIKINYVNATIMDKIKKFHYVALM